MYHPLIFLLFTFCYVSLSAGKPQQFLRDNALSDWESAVRLSKNVREEFEWDSNRCHSKARVQRDDHYRFPRHARGLDTSFPDPDAEAEIRAVYFTADSDFLVYQRMWEEDFAFPRQQFTAEMWVKPEGGQRTPAVIAELSDKCQISRSIRGWSLYIDVPSPGEVNGAEFKFSLMTDRSIENTTVRAHHPYEANVWVHVVVTFDGWTMRLYLDGTMVGADVGQRGAVFSAASQRCKEFTLGGSQMRWAPFRGAIARLRMYDVVRTQDEIASSSISMETDNNAVIREHFESANFVNWSPSEMQVPATISADIVKHPTHPRVSVPQCGMTVCDSPDVARSYINNRELRGEVVLRYRPILLAEDDGSNPTVSSDDLRLQHRLLSEAFRPHNITWLDIGAVVVRSTLLRHRPVLSHCDSRVGNGICDRQCSYQITGFDGGDCDDPDSECPDSQIGDGVCQAACNKAYHDWDGGDCCVQAGSYPVPSCYDPNSPARTFISADSLKSMINITSSSALNIFFVDFVDVDVEGFATMPWDPNALGIQGGVVIQGGDRLSNSSLIHEMGHVLGLLHVHHGISEISCTDPCYEISPSLETGDLVEDTNPTPTNLYCRDPTAAESESALGQCDVDSRLFVNTPFTNYMSYANASCTDHFTVQQGARMQCYVDLTYASWSPSLALGNIPLPPRVMSEGPQGGVTIAWTPPLSGYHRKMADTSRCADCTIDSAFVQYAAAATSDQKAKMIWQIPSQATGPPDAKRCEFSENAWMSVSARNYLDLTIDEPVVPARLTFWVNFVYGSRDVISNVKLLFEDDSTQSLGPISVDCDIPYTTRIVSTQRLVGMRIEVGRPITSIDAVQIASVRNADVCQACAPHRYRVVREPPFPLADDVIQEVDSLWFTDRWAQNGSVYSYRVQPVLGQAYGVTSPPVFHQRGLPFCGNGRTESSSHLREDCDDGNQEDGDGCDRHCKTEQYYVCEGEPSRCRRFLEDGTCEDFEHAISEKDCGFYTPPGYSDQWAHSASANPVFQREECPITRVVGPPTPGRECIDELTLDDAWFPCGEALEDSNDYWIKLGFKKAVIATSVIVHLAGVHTYNFDNDPPRISVQLLDPTGKSHFEHSEFIFVSCDDNPIHFNISQDLSKPFLYTQYVKIQVTSPQVAISGIRLRSFDTFNPIALSGCRKHEMFNPSLQRCVDYHCETPPAAEPTIRYANATCDGLLDGDKCRVQCIPGYRPSAPITLQNIGGVWEGPTIVCKPVDCGMPLLDSVVAIAACPTGTTFGKECSFKCIPPAKLQGTDNTLRCEEDGLFSLAESFCQVLCDAPLAPRHAAPLNLECLGDGHNVGTTCKFRCKTGYVAAKKKGRPTRIVRYQCNDNSTWTGPRCEPVECPAPPLVYQGLYNCTNGFKYKSQCTLLCPNDDSFSNTITCTKDGLWDREFHRCQFPLQCSPPVPPLDVILECPDGHDIDSKCTARCRLGNIYQIALEGATYRQRGLIGKKDEVICTASGDWYPSLNDIQCQDICWERSIDDDQCDSQNNREYCLWDNGSCCPSTSPRGRVSVFPPDCGAACACKDPNADENMRQINGSVRKNRPPS